MLIHAQKAQDLAETRAPLTPDSAKKLIGLGASVQAESGVGAASGYPDTLYEAVGVRFVEADGGKTADILISVELPTNATFSGMKKDATFVGRMEPFNNQATIQAAADANINAVSLEMMPRTTIAQKMDILSSQANLAGYYAVIAAAERSNKLLPMMMTPAGTLAPARVFVIGVGVAGLQAIATAKRLGARVFAFDTRPVVEEQVKSLGAKFVKIDLGEMSETKDGYAKALTPEQIKLQQAGMAKVIAQSDVVITTAKLFGRPAPLIVTNEMIAGMKPGSIIVDLAAETGGNCAGCVADEETLTENGVRIIGINKLENHLPYHASQMFAANIANFIEHFWDKEENLLNLNMEDEIIQGVLLTQNGTIIHPKFKKEE